MTDQLKAKIEKSKETLRLAAEMSEHYYQEPIVICYSGGKDSDVILRLAMDCLKPEQFEVLHSITTVDSPVTNRYVNEVYKELESKGIKCSKSIAMGADEKPTNMWKLIPEKKMPPTRIVRYCCKVLKETATPNRIAVLGVREDESTKRKGRNVFGVRGGSYSEATFFSLEHTAEVHREALEKEKEPNGTVWDCTIIKVMRDKQDTVVSPIYEWSDNDVWDYLKAGGWKYNPMYDMGYHRVGCIGCPMATYRQKMKEFADFPTYKQHYIKAFDEMLERNPKAKRDWKTGEDVFNWWIERDHYVTKGQMTIADYETDEWGLIVRKKETE